MTSRDSQLAMLPVYLLILAAIAIALLAVYVDLLRTLRRRVRHESPDLLKVSLSRPGQPARRAPRPRVRGARPFRSRVGR